jgi:hypothetical protein
MNSVHPIVEPLRKWLSENERSLDSTTLGEPRKFNQYLENRIREAFQAGWDAHEKHAANGGA